MLKETIMNNKNIRPSLKLSWDEVNHYFEQLLSVILQRKIQITCSVEDNSFWTAASKSYLFSVNEINKLLKYADITDEATITEAIPEDNKPTHSIGMRLSEELLKKAINCSWDCVSVSDECMWICGIEEQALTGDIMFIGNTAIERRKLWSMENVISYLEDSYSIYADLVDLAHEYVKEFGNELYWDYPISDGLHNGVYFFVVYEGILCLPYNKVTEEDGVHFITKEAKICSSEDMQYFINDFNKYAASLMKTMQNLKAFAKELEA